MQKLNVLVTVIMFAIVVGFVVVVFNRPNTDVSPERSLGSVAIGNDYQSVVTATQKQGSGLLMSGSGTLGSVVVTGAATGVFTLYDASTTDVTKRALATTSLRQLASFPASVATGTYQFDINFFYGLAVEFTGTQGTTTITFR